MKSRIKLFSIIMVVLFIANCTPPPEKGDTTQLPDTPKVEDTATEVPTVLEFDFMVYKTDIDGFVNVVFYLPTGNELYSIKDLVRVPNNGGNPIPDEIQLNLILERATNGNSPVLSNRLHDIKDLPGTKVFSLEIIDEAGNVLGARKKKGLLVDEAK